jgi:Transglycosylase SLT domain
MRVKKILTALRGGRLRRDLRRTMFTLVAFLVIAVPSSAVIEGMSASSIGDAVGEGLMPWEDDESFFGDEELLFGDDGGDIFDADGGELDFLDWDIYEPFPDDVEAAGFAPEEDFFYEEEIADNLTADGIPFVAVQAYQRAEATSAVADPGCGVPWTLLAAIGRVESDHGRFGGSRLLSNGDGTRPIRGVPLDGGPGIARILDTDGGALDGDTTYDRAVGPMQFIPSTWRGVAVDGNRDSRRDPNNIFDATLGAAGYLCSGPGVLRDPAQQAAAVRRYNHTDEYVRVVMSVAAQYADHSVGQPRVPQPDTAPQPSPQPSPPPATRPAPQPAPPTTQPAPRPAPPTTQAPAPPTTQAPPTTAPAPPTTQAPAPAPEDPAPPEVEAPEAPESPRTPDEPTPPGGPDVPEDTGIPTDPTQDDAPVGEELPPAAVGWSGTMLEFVDETLAERTECADAAEGEAPAPESAPCPAPGAPAEGGEDGAVAPALDVEGGTGREHEAPLPA